MSDQTLRRQRKPPVRKVKVFTLFDIARAWDKALGGSKVAGFPVARSFESFSYRAFEDALMKRRKRKG